MLYTLPAPRARLSELAEREGTLAMLGVEVIAVPTDAAPDAIRRLGEEPRVLFPVVTEGADDIVAAYRLFAAGPHVEFLIDRQGYVRATREALARRPGPDRSWRRSRSSTRSGHRRQPPEEHVH